MPLLCASVIAGVTALASRGWRPMTSQCCAIIVSIFDTWSSTPVVYCTENEISWGCLAASAFIASTMETTAGLARSDSSSQTFNCLVPPVVVPLPPQAEAVRARTARTKRALPFIDCMSSSLTS